MKHIKNRQDNVKSLAPDQKVNIGVFFNVT